MDPVTSGSLPAIGWHQIVIVSRPGMISISRDGRQLLEYRDRQPLHPGRIALRTIAPHSRFFVDNLLVRDIAPGVAVAHDFEIDVAAAAGKLPRSYRCATLWTLDNDQCSQRRHCPVPFSPDGPTARTR